METTIENFSIGLFLWQAALLLVAALVVFLVYKLIKKLITR